MIILLLALILFAILLPGLMRFFFAMIGLFIIALFMIAAAHAASPYEGSIDHKHDANWKRVVENATKLSLKQHHGHLDFVHACYAEGKDAFCADTIAYTIPSSGRLQFVRVIRRGEDNSMFARDICTFNKEKTLRACFNYDNGYESYWRENDEGDWVQVDREKSDDEAASGGL